jgi:hypothetical protein
MKACETAANRLGDILSTIFSKMDLSAAQVHKERGPLFATKGESACSTQWQHL